MLLSHEEGISIEQEASARGAETPSPEMYRRMQHYGDLVQNGKAGLDFSYQGMEIGSCCAGRFRWDCVLLEQLLKHGSPWDELTGKPPTRTDERGSISKRPDYVWSVATGNPHYVAARHATDEPSYYMSGEFIARVMCCAHLFWDGTCSIWFSDIGSALWL